uniref:Uncharacterized protein n=1 Tax=Arundo donax TaxID=35708 RepID=A0A0A9FVF3_ARUDO
MSSVLCVLQGPVSCMIQLGGFELSRFESNNSVIQENSRQL